MVNTQGLQVEWAPVCPEVEMGLPVPWESLRLVREEENLHGFLFKKDWPQPIPRFHLSGASSSLSVIHQAQRPDRALALYPKREYNV